MKILDLIAKSQSESNKALSAKVQAQEIADKASAALAEINQQLGAAVETAKRENGCASITQELACVPTPKLPEKKEPVK